MTSKISKLIISLLIISTLVTIPTSSVNTDQITTVKVALLTPITGSLSDFSSGFENAALLAIQHLNNDETINTSYNFELKIYDTQSEESGAIPAIIDAIGNGSHYIVGPASSWSTLAAAPYAVQSQIPIISYSATSPEISTYDDHANPLDHGYVWRTVISDEYQGIGISRLAFDGNFKEIGILSMNNTWGMAHIDRIVSDFQNLGGEVSFIGLFPQGTTEYVEIIDALLESTPELIIVIGFHVETGNIHIELAKRNIEIPTIATTSSGKLFFEPINGSQEAMENSLIILPGVRESEYSRDFRIAYTAQFNSSPYDIYIEHTYDAVFAGANAITTIGSTDGSEIIAALSNLNFLGPSGPVSFDENGDSISGLFDFYEVRNGSFENVAKWGTIDGLWYNDMDFKSRWRSNDQTSTLTIETTIENTVDNTIATTVTELSASIPVPFMPIIIALLISFKIGYRRHRNKNN